MSVKVLAIGKTRRKMKGSLYFGFIQKAFYSINKN